LNHDVRWTEQKLEQRLELIGPFAYGRKVELPSFRYRALTEAQPHPPTDNGDAGTIVPPNTYWGDWETSFVLRTSFEVPHDWDRAIPIALLLAIGDAGDFCHPEAMVYIDGKSCAACDRNHQEVTLPEWVRDGRPHELVLHGFTGLGANLRRGENGRQLFMRACHVVQIDRATRDFVATARVAHGVAATLDVNRPERAELLTLLDAAFKTLDTREPIEDRLHSTVAAAHALLKEGLGRIGGAEDVGIVAVGHAHIDVAWLWTLAQTRQKAGRTFRTVLELMKQFPEYRFTQSQPQLYDYVRNDYPELYAEIKERIAEGRWETIGGMWVEADCNLTGAESLARQFLIGRTFFRDEFGSSVDSPVLWLPDVFGYAWSLPQLIKQAGLEYFFTIKIGWNQYNRLPYDTFWWQGIDGTKVLTHFSATPGEVPGEVSTYNARVTPRQMLRTWTNFQQKGEHKELLMAFGYGDGGGGPTMEMLENIREMVDFPGAPAVRHGLAKDFFRDLEASAGGTLPTWNGELYLEYHRGTYTTQARNKRDNRRSEFGLHDAEFLAAAATVADPAYRYPHETLGKVWKLVCLNQFHDIIPGTSIAPVYADSAKQYEKIFALLGEVRNAALASLSARLGGDLLLINPTSFARADVVRSDAPLLPGTVLRTAGGQSLNVQRDGDGVLVQPPVLPPFSITVCKIFAAPDAPSDSGMRATPSLLENDFIRVELNAVGDIARIYDKRCNREVLAEGKIGNQFQVFEDRPLKWDAWDVDIFYDDKMWLSEPAESIEVVANGPLRIAIAIKRRIMDSAYVQTIALNRDSARIDFSTTIDWRERHMLLKVAFPVEILSPLATYEVQWGNVERPTHRNTSWDWARFETCAHKWVDLGEGDYGVSLLNDCKHGHDIRDSVIRLSLLRSPSHPDPTADLGEHTFAYSLLPHIGRWGRETIAAAYAINDPLIVHRAVAPGSPETVAAPESFATIDEENVVIETVKQAEDGNGFIVRMYECLRSRGKITLRTGFALKAASITNILEEEQETLAVDSDVVSLSIAPYQIVTVRLVPA
jgi:alpha-mannosidase